MISRGGRVERDDERHDRDHEREDGDRARPEIAATLLPEARERGLQNREDDEVLRRPGLSYEQALDSSRPGNTSSRSGRGGGRDGRRRCWGRLRARRRWPECRSARRSSLPGCPRGSSRTRPGAVCRSPAEARSLSEVASQLTRAQPPRRSGWAPLTAPSTSAADQGSRRTRRPGRRIAAQPDAPGSRTPDTTSPTRPASAYCPETPPAPSVVRSGYRPFPSRPFSRLFSQEPEPGSDSRGTRPENGSETDPRDPGGERLRSAALPRDVARQRLLPRRSSERSR